MPKARGQGQDWLIKVSRPTQHNTGHFRDVVVPSQFLGIVLKKLNQTHQKQTTKEQNTPR